MGRYKKLKKSRRAQTKPKKAIESKREEDYTKTPHSFVIHRGEVGKSVRHLVRDLRTVMSPYTASNLKSGKKNVLKDYVAIAGPLNVTHLMSFSRSELSLNLRVMRLPRGPTLTFNVLEYSLCRDVISSIRRHNMDPKQFLQHPLLAMNNFSGDGRHYQLMATMFQNMFLSINVNQVKLSNIRRVVLLHYDNDTDGIEFRHYNIRTVPIGLGRGVKKLLKSKVPNMANLDDISEFVIRGGNLSESEGELDGPHNEITLPQDLPGRGNTKSNQSAIRLTEIGPRMKLRLVKIESEICAGEVLYHQFIERSKEELQMAEKRREEKRLLKDQRKRQQEQNVQKKQHIRKEQKEKSLSGMKKEADVRVSDEVEAEEDDDVAYYKSAVGVEPEADLLLKRAKKRSSQESDNPQPDKRRRKSTDVDNDSNAADKFNRGRGNFKRGRVGDRGGFSRGGRGRGSFGGSKTGTSRNSSNGRESGGFSLGSRGSGRSRGAGGSRGSSRGGESFGYRGSSRVLGRGGRLGRGSGRGRGAGGSRGSGRGRGAGGSRGAGGFSSRLSFRGKDRSSERGRGERGQFRGKSRR